MNYYDATKVAYETGPKETPLPVKSKNAQFPGNKMPQGNKTSNGKEYVEREYPANPVKRGGRFEEYR